MALDTRTLIYGIAVTNVVMALGVFAAQPVADRRRVGSLWMAANVALFAGWALLLLRGTIPLFLSLVIGNIMLALGWLAQYEAIIALRSLKAQRSWMWPSFVLFAAAFCVLFYVGATGERFIIFASLFDGLIGVTIALSLSNRAMRPLDWLLASSFAAFAAVMIFRGIETAIVHDNPVFLTSSAKQTLVFVVVFATSIASSFAFIMMTKEEADARLLALATHDALTGVLNRRAVLDRANVEWEHAARSAQPFSLLLLDLDMFKNINDTYGHIVGDAVLAGFARIAKSQLRPYDVFGRYGGEEFLVLLPQTSAELGNAVAKRIQKVVEATIHPPPMSCACTVSIGGACAPPESTLADLMGAADRSLYKAKHDGRNCVVFSGL